MPKKSKRDAGLNMRRKKFRPNESIINNCEDGDQIVSKEGNVDENNIKNSSSEEKNIEKK